MRNHMENLAYLSPFESLPFPLKLHRINKYYFGEECIKLESGEKLYDHLMSPLNTFFFVVKSDKYEKLNLYFNDIVIIERKLVRIDGPAAVIIDNEMQIKDIRHNREFCTISIEDGFELIEGKDFTYWGTISYGLRSDESMLLEQYMEDLFQIY